jgi:hypothetical protein
MPLPPSEIARIEEKISEEDEEIARKRARLDGVGPVEKAEIELDISEREGLVRGWVNQLRVGEVGFG